ncbi:MAG: TIGR02757 family protein [Marinilabiliales bacterium]|nr:MAG: TIGR02757 family protein [Marinilabiliales bacterium]
MTEKRELQNIKEFLDEKSDKYNHSDFIETDPIQIPHTFTDHGDIEISGFLAATIAWGQRITIIKNLRNLMTLMDHAPYEFILHHTEKDLDRFSYFKHRTFNGDDCKFFIQSLKNIYAIHGGLGKVVQNFYQAKKDVFDVLIEFRKIFFEINHPQRTQKHFSNVLKGASAKRLNMYFRWMIREDFRGVDFGLWKEIPMSSLYLPLDVHTGNVARKLGILLRKQNDWKAVEEITQVLRTFDPVDPVKYDFALFGLGAFEKF